MRGAERLTGDLHVVDASEDAIVSRRAGQGVLRLGVGRVQRDVQGGRAGGDELQRHLREVVSMLLEDGEPKQETEYVGVMTVRSE